jgi:hypothetical protein
LIVDGLELRDSELSEYSQRQLRDLEAWELREKERERQERLRIAWVCVPKAADRIRAMSTLHVRLVIAAVVAFLAAFGVFARDQWPTRDFD